MVAVLANTYLPFSAGPGSAVSEDQWRSLAREWLADGVVFGRGAHLKVTQEAPVGMNVEVGAGQIRLRGHMGIFDAATTLDIAANGTADPRIDVVVARVDYVANTIALDVVQGAPAPAPVAPALDDDASSYEMPLAYVAVAAGAVSIVNANITDARHLVYPQDHPVPVYTTAERDALVDPPEVIWNSTLSRLQTRVAGVWTSVRLEGGVTVRLAWNYLLPGEVKVQASTTDYLPWSHISVGAGQTVKLVGYRWMLGYGTSFTFKISHSDGAVTTDLVTGVVATSASFRGSGNFGAPMTLNSGDDGDLWKPTITAVSGTPIGGSIALVVDVTG